MAQISSREAEARLGAINKPKAYLFRESDVKSKKFILSYISDTKRGLFKHVVVPTQSAKKTIQVSSKLTVSWRR